MTCPDCDEPLVLTFQIRAALAPTSAATTSTPRPTPITSCALHAGRPGSSGCRAPVTPDVVGDLAFFVCRRADCGGRLVITHESLVPTDIELTCPRGHGYIVVAADGGGLMLQDD